MRKLIFCAAIIAILPSCSVTKIVRYSKQPDNVFANNTLKEFFKTNKAPNIVLRVPNNNDKATSNTSNDNTILYKTIENEFVKQGFTVRDRGLFNEILNKAQTSDYSNIKELTNTDIILEVVNIDPAVVYSTNKVIYIRKKKETERLEKIDYQKYGASVEFSLIIVKNNEIAGTYKYNYQPCPAGCEVEMFEFQEVKDVKKAIKKVKNAIKKTVLKETVSTNILEDFISSCTKDLIKSIRD